MFAIQETNNAPRLTNNRVFWALASGAVRGPRGQLGHRPGRAAFVALGAPWAASGCSWAGPGPWSAAGPRLFVIRSPEKQSPAGSGPHGNRDGSAGLPPDPVAPGEYTRRSRWQETRQVRSARGSYRLTETRPRGGPHGKGQNMTTENQRTHVRVVFVSEEIEIIASAEDDHGVPIAQVWKQAIVSAIYADGSFKGTLTGENLGCFLMPIHEGVTWRRAQRSHLHGCSWAHIGQCNCDVPIAFAPVAAS